MILHITPKLPPIDDFNPDINNDIDDSEINPSFNIQRADTIRGVAEAQDFVEGLLTEGGASVLYGPSNCGKSFFALDLAATVATGRDFRDELEVEKGAVVYVALEGSHGTRNRIEALRQENKLPDDAPLFLCFDNVSLLEPGHGAQLAEAVKNAASQAGIPCRLIILDTLARAMAGGDENGGRDMTRAVETIDLVRAATGAHVMLIHHCGKDEARGARGHSSLRAAVDTEIEVSRPEGDTVSTVRITKQRDMQPGGPYPFSLVAVNLGTCRRGKPITSCRVKHEDGVMANQPRKAGRKARYHAEDLLAFLPAINATDWQKRTCEETGMPRSVFYDLKKELKTNSRTRTNLENQAITRA